MSVTNSNARGAIEKLLTTETSHGKYSCGSEISAPVPSVKILSGNKKLSFPLDAQGIEDIKNNAERAGVGLPDRTVVNLDVRKTWQIKPRNLDVTNVDQALESALRAVAVELGTEAEYNIEANLYKLLLYEPGCFFARHRDNERLDGMFGTLVLELPSEYTGAELSVWSPLTPNEKMAYKFNGESSLRTKRKTRSNKPGLHFAAFYADCYHEVSKLTSGHRVALVYHLTANPVQHRLQPHLPAVKPSPPQPADESIALRLAKLVEQFAQENNENYPEPPEETGSWRPPRESPRTGKPKKLAVVLSHEYTPASLSGIEALKGSDRGIAELIRASAYYSPDKADVSSSLARLAAKKVTEVGGEEYSTSQGLHQAHDLVSETFNKGRKSGSPVYDAAIALAFVYDTGEGTLSNVDNEEFGMTSFFTTGPLIPLFGDKAGPSLDLGPQLPNDTVAVYHPSFHGGKEDLGQPFEYFGPETEWGPAYNWNGPIVYGEQAHHFMCEPGNHSLPIYSHELLFASEEAASAYRSNNSYYSHISGKHVFVESSPKEIEFLGNGMPYMGRVYSRAVIMIWPRAHREGVQMQAKGGRAVLKAKEGE